MTAQTNQPAKFLVPFAQNDSSRVEIPVTTSDATRASQSAGFPPLTMQPPEAGGVPPQGEDFNGAMNQVARIAWWLMLGGGFAFDSAFATATQIGGYPKGAVLQGVDRAGAWISVTDNNTTNPDTSTDPAGGGYVPGYQYGTTVVTGLTGGAVTLTNAQAAKRTITLAGTLTSALTLIVPTWLKEWSVVNNTTGAFSTTVKTAAGTGIVIPQNGAPTLITGNGTNITQPSQNIAIAATSTGALTLGQAQSLFAALAGLSSQPFDVAKGLLNTQAVRLDQFQGTLAATGWVSFPNTSGIYRTIILQWGVVSAPANSNANYTLATTFPNGAFSCVVSRFAGGSDHAVNANPLGLSQIAIQNYGTATENVGYIILGN